MRYSFRTAFRPSSVVIAGLSILFGLTGCGGGERLPPLLPVEGTVKMNGKPLASAELSFIPDPSNKDVTIGSAFTADDGTYKVRFLSKMGLSAGKYVVTVRKSEVDDISKIPDAMKNDPAQLEMMGVTKPVLNDRYSSPEKSPFRIEVAESGGPYDFELDTKGR